MILNTTVSLNGVVVLNTDVRLNDVGYCCEVEWCGLLWMPL